MSQRSWRSTSALLGLFLLLSLIKASRHEMWADELEYWNAARESHSLDELRQNTRYIGQPPLSHLALYALSRFTRDPRAMQVLNVLVVTAAVGVVAAWAPWTALEKWLFAFGYFPFFEYGTISRPYALSLLFAVAACAAFGGAPRLRPLAGGFAFLMAQTSFHATIVVLALLISVLAEPLLTRRRPGPGELPAMAFMAVGVALSVALAVPPADSPSLKPWRFAWDAGRALLAGTQIWSGYAPLPPTGPPWWNHNLLDFTPAGRLALGLLLFGLFAFALRRCLAALLLLVTGTLGLLLFGYQQWGGYARHQGLLYVVLVMSLWLARARTRLFVPVLIAQLAGGLFMSYKDLVLPFSPGLATANYIRASHLDTLPMVGHEEYLIASVATFLDQPFYSPASQRWTTRVEWGPRLRRVSEADILAAVREVQREKKCDVLVVVNDNLAPGPRLRLLACFGEEFMGQHFCVYRATRASR